MTASTNQPEDDTYVPYYMRAIHRQLQEGQLNGLKEVVGPTGMGKTFAIPGVIEQVRALDLSIGCIYTTHRHALLEEMRRDLAKRGIPSVYLKSNSQVVVDFVHIPDLQAFLFALERQDFFKGANTTLKMVQELIHEISTFASQQLQALKQHDKLARMAREKLIEERDRHCAELMNVFEAGLKAASDRQRADLLQHPYIWQLFPYVAFLKNPTKPVLLVTVRKLLHGFFDGRRQQRITSLKGNLIFLDEFEIQEGEILAYMCEHDGIRNNFEFVRLFYNEMDLQKRLGYLQQDSMDTSERNTARQFASDILETIENECQRGGYTSYPAITRFRMSPTEFRNEKAITVFQSSHIVQTTPFYITDEGNAWRIVGRKTDQTVSSLQFLYTVSRATDRILEFFAQLWSDGLELEWAEYIDHCYNKLNDNTHGAYQDTISGYGMFKRPMRLLKGRTADAIRNSVYYKGFSLYKLTTGKYAATSPEEVDIRQKTLHITPEYILWQLCQHNLVFGISATGDIHRYINAFDMQWLQENCQYIPVDTTDTELIARLKAQKDSTRQYDIRFGFATTLANTHPLTGFLDGLEAEGLFGETHQKAVDSRRIVVSRILETLRWVAHESTNVTHLVFVNSFAAIKRLLDKKVAMHESERDDLTQHLAVRHRGEQEYLVMIDGKPCHVILLNAAKVQEHVSAFSYQANLGPLIIVTQYETAANGVNLEWIDTADSSSTAHDFQGIHLLEGKHFYFDTERGDTNGRTLDIEKMFIWQAWKLAEGRQISQRHLETYLKSWNISEFNTNLYKQTPDYLLNQIALFHQAFGRVDRKRYERHVTDVRLSDTSSTGHADDGVFHLLARYLNESGAIGQHREARAIYTSTLILNIHDAVTQHSRRRQVSNQFYREDIAPIQARSRERIQLLLELIAQMKQGTYTESESLQIKALWHRIREAMLRQDYQFTDEVRLPRRPGGIQVDFQRDFVHKTAYLQLEDMLFVDRPHDANRIFRDASIDTVPYSLNWPYRRLAENAVVSRFFSTRNYQLSYYHTTPNYLFTPHALQAIVAGAVGETALQALLEDAGIGLDNPKDHPTALFEDFDLKIQAQPVYLDAKSFGRETIFRMNAQPDDPLYNPQLNGPLLLQKAQKKWERIVNITGESNAKFVIVNLQVEGAGSNQYWDATLCPVSCFRDSAITLIQGAIDSADPTVLRPSFRLWLDEIRNM